MPMSKLEQDTLSKDMLVSKQVLLDIQPKLASLKELYDSAVVSKPR